MSRRKPKEEPEMLIVSFCDIVTITTAAMFFAMLITTMEAVKVPVFKPTPRAQVSNKQAAFFECRNKEVFFIDKAKLDDQVATMLAGIPLNQKSDPKAFIRLISETDTGDEHYRVVPSYLLTAVMALEPRPLIHGDDEAAVTNQNSKFHAALRALNKDSQYAVFLVRDDSFQVFRIARLEADHAGFDIGWELLGIDEPIKFGAGGTSIGTQ